MDSVVLQAILDATPTLVYLYDREGRVVFVSRSVVEFLGRPREAFLGKTLAQMGFAAELVEQFETQWRRVMAEKTRVTEVAFYDDGRATHHLEYTLTPILDEDGSVVQVVSTVQNVTARVQEAKGLRRARDTAEGARRELLDLVTAVLETSPVGITLVGPEGHVLAWNPADEALFGWTKQEALGRFAPYVINDDQAEYREMLERVLAGESILNRDVRRICKDGSLLDISLSAGPVRDRNGRVVGVLGIQADVTGQRRADHRVQAQLARMNLLNQITRAIASRQDPDSLFRVVLENVEQLLPADGAWLLSSEPDPDVLQVRAVGKKVRTRAASAGLAEGARVAVGENGMLACLRGQTVHERDARLSTGPILKKLAESGACSVVAAPMASEDRVLGALMAVREQPDGFESGDAEFLRQVAEHVALAFEQQRVLTQLRKSNDDLRLAQQTIMQQERLRAMGQMASGIAHDINNALGPITLYAESLLERSPEKDETSRRYLKAIQTAADDIARTVKRMREFYRKRDTVLVAVPVDVNKLVTQVVELTRPRWHDIPMERGLTVTVRTELEPGLPDIPAQESELRDALINMVFNAVDALAEGGTLTLRTRALREDGAVRHVVLEVSDTGIGMDDDTRRRCLEPFFTTKGERGTGLGLAMVYGTVERHGGRVEIESCVGQGSTFRLVLPMRETATRQTAPAPSVVPPSRILCIDDEQSMRVSLGEILRRDGHTVFLAGRGQEGLDVLRVELDRGEPIDVVITDLGMPFMDGREVARLVKLEFPGTPVVMLSGWGEDMRSSGDRPANVDRVASKPVRIEDLRTILASVQRETASVGRRTNGIREVES